MIVCLCGCTTVCFGKVVTEVIGSLFDGPLSRLMVFGPSNCGRRITFGLVGFTGPIGPPMRPVEPLPVAPPPRLPTGLPSPPPVTGPLIGGLSIGMLFDGVPVMQRRELAPLSLAEGSLFTTIGGLGSGRVLITRQAPSLNTIPTGQTCGFGSG